MKIIIDTNIIISALMKDSITREIIVKSGWDFYYPERALQEIRKHEAYMMKKTGMRKSDYDELLKRLLKYVSLINDELVLAHLRSAKRLMAAIDPDDVIFISATLSLKDAILWSDDKDFDRQKAVKTLKTEKVIRLFMDAAK